MAKKSIGLLNIVFGADLRGFDRAMKKAQKSLKKFGSSMKRTGANLTRNLTLPLLALGAASIKAFDTQAKAIAQVEAGLKSTGNQVGLTSKELQKMAADLQKTTLFGDEVILKDATAQLLTFTNLTKENFQMAQVAALDLATRLDKDLKETTIQLGKALNDPILGITALGRSGIQFTEKQKSTIKSLVETNKLAEAQTLILKELEIQYGGSAEAAAKAGMGPLQQLGNALSDVGEKIGAELLPIVIEIGNKIKGLLTSFTSLDKDTQKVIITIGLLAGAIGPLLFIVGQLTLAFAALFTPGGVILLGIIALAAGLVYVVDNFEALKERLSDWDWWRNALIQAMQWVIEYSPLSLLIKGFNEVLKFFGKNPIPNPFEDIADALEDLKVETKEYEHEFGSFADAVKNAALKAGKALSGLGGLMGVGGGGGTTTDPDIPFALDPKSAGAGAPFIGPLEQSAEALEKIRLKMLEVNAATALFSDIMQNSMMDAANSQEGFFQSLFENLKRAIKQMLIQLAVLTAINIMLGGKGTTVSKAFGLAKGKLLGIPAGANGLLATGPTLALVGEGSGTSMANPEVVAPLDKLKSYIGGGDMRVTGRLVGNDIFLSNEKAGVSRNRFV